MPARVNKVHIARLYSFSSAPLPPPPRSTNFLHLLRFCVSPATLFSHLRPSTATSSSSSGFSATRPFTRASLLISISLLVDRSQTANTAERTPANYFLRRENSSGGVALVLRRATPLARFPVKIALPICRPTKRHAKSNKFDLERWEECGTIRRGGGCLVERRWHDVRRFVVEDLRGSVISPGNKIARKMNGVGNPSYRKCPRQQSHARCTQTANVCAYRKPTPCANLRVEQMHHTPLHD